MRAAPKHLNINPGKGALPGLRMVMDCMVGVRPPWTAGVSAFNRRMSGQMQEHNRPHPTFLMLELLFFGRAFQGGGRALAALNGLGNRVEVPGADFTLMLHGGETTISCRKFGFL